MTDNSRTTNPKIPSWFILTVLVILVTGIAGTLWVVQQQDQAMREDLLKETRIASTGVDVETLHALTGSAQDLTSPAYLSVKDLMTRYRDANPDLRFAYLVGKRPDGSYFIFADSENPSSPDYSPPGDDFSDIPSPVAAIFNTGNQTTIGPYTDKWGTWMSGYYPVVDPATGEISAILGLDVDAWYWNRQLIKAGIVPFTGMLLMILLLVMFLNIHQRNERETRQLRDSEKKIQESERRFRQLFERSHALMLIIEPESGQIFDANPAAVQFYGYAKDVLCSMKIDEINQLPKEQVRNLRTLAVPMEKNFFIFPHRLSDGRIRTVEVNSSPIEIDGKTYLFSIINDITERKEAENALAESEEELHEIFNVITDAIHIYAVDEQGIPVKIIHVNHASSTMLGYSPSELLAMHPFDIIYRYDPVETERIREQLRVNGTAVFETVYRKNDNSPLPVEIKAHNAIIKGLNVIVLVIRDITERKRAKEALADSEANFRVFFETIGDMIIVGTRDGQILFTNPVLAKKLGYTPEELRSMRILDLHPADRRKEAEEIFAMMFRGERDECPLPLVTKSGTLIPVETRVWFGRWNGMDCIFGISKDLTTEQEAKQRFERLFQNNPALMALSLLPERTIIDVNGAFLSSLGYSRDEVLGKTVDELRLFPDVDMQKMVAQMLRDTGRVSNIQLQVMCKDRTQLEGVFSGEVISSQGRDYFLTVMIDNTEQKLLENELLLHEKELLKYSRELTDDIAARKRVEAELRETAERLGLATRAGNVGIWDWDVVNNQLIWDDQMYRLYGITADQFGGAYDAWQAGLHPDDKVRGDNEIHMALSGEKEFNTEFRVYWPDGTTRYIRALANVMRDSMGKPVRMIGTNWDITDRKLSEQAIKKANRQLNLLGSITRHDINNKIMVILGYLSLLEKKSANPALEGYLEKAMSATEAVQKQIEFTKVYQDLGSHEPQWQDMEKVIPLEQTPQGVTLRATLPGIEVFADPMLPKVFYNLLDNSIRHGEHVTEIRVSSAIENGVLNITWEDNGVGIPADLKEKIFDRGFGKNTGLGMFLTREILSLSDMTIKETGEPGKGARFEITVPTEMFRIKS